ncbi:MAG: hypothetical protein LBQ31_05240 [Bacteroidales bacterium]|jgi:hypothetical protein|nr:hypothetical protein [Bacteroidales bacterium]
MKKTEKRKNPLIWDTSIYPDFWDRKATPINNPKDGEQPIYRKVGFGKDIIVRVSPWEEIVKVIGGK